MFNSKKTQLFENSNKETSGSIITSAKIPNGFLNSAKQRASRTLSGNGALKYKSTGNDFVDQFGILGSYKAPRDFAKISTDMSTLWGLNPLMCMCLVFFIRMITRVTSLFDGTRTSSVQRGSGLRYEGIMRMIWVHIYHPDTFYKNITLFLSIGSWKDLIQMLSYDLQFNGWKDRQLDWDKLGKILLSGLENESHRNLILKYIPQIKANSKCNTIESQADNMIAKWICSLLFKTKEGDESRTYKQYRKLKTSGTAHQWQQLISKKLLNQIDFDTVHGRALSQLVSGKFLANQGLEGKYEEWISQKPVAKFTGYVHELFKSVSQGKYNRLITLKKYQMDTINAQFMGLVKTAQEGANASTNMIVVRDTSSSMGSPATGTSQNCYSIAKALSLFFSYMLPKGVFADSWIEFNSKATLHTWKGSTPVEKWNNDTSNFVGSTDFISVVQLFCQIKLQGTSESEFPSGIICISDGEFNPTVLSVSNVQMVRGLLSSAGFSPEYVENFKIVLWNLQSNAYGSETGKKFETYGDVKNVFYFSGYDGSIVSFLTGKEVQKDTKAPSTAEELFKAAMNQEVMSKIEI